VELCAIGMCPELVLPAARNEFFYASDRDEPPHIHVERDDKLAKFWLRPVRLERSGGFSRREINRIQKLVDESVEALLRSWSEYFED
jgi:hypothetical protein